MNLKSSHWRFSTKKAFLKMSQILQENTCVGVSFLKMLNMRKIDRNLTRIFLFPFF